MKKRFIFALAGFVFSLFVFSCSKEKTTSIDPDNQQVIKNKTLFDTYMKARTSATQPSYFELKEIKRENGILTIKIWGDCNKEHYKVVWDGAVMESLPMQINLLIAYDRPKDLVCDASLHEHTLEVDLKELLGENFKDSDYIIHILNGSQEKDKTGNPNGTVTDKK
ncbi:MAG: hypothetical protein U0X91_18835 [Spirosomataceae bacterium]